MEKLVLAQDTSNIDDSEMSLDEIKERNKKIRRVKAKKYLSSADEYSDENEEYDMIKENLKNKKNSMKKKIRLKLKNCLLFQK